MNFEFQSCKLMNRKYSCYGLDSSGLEFRLVQEILYPPKCPERAWGPPRLAIERLPVFSGVKTTKG